MRDIDNKQSWVVGGLMSDPVENGRDIITFRKQVSNQVNSIYTGTITPDKNPTFG